MLNITDYSKNYVCAVDCHRKCPVIKKMEDLSADIPILVCKFIFSEYGLPKKITSDAGGNFISDKFKTFYKNLSIEQAVSSSYHHQSNEEVEAHKIYQVDTQKMLGH